MTTKLVFIIWSKNKFTGVETTTGKEHLEEATAKEIAEILDKTFISYSHRVEAISKKEN